MHCLEATIFKCRLFSNGNCLDSQMSNAFCSAFSSASSFLFKTYKWVIWIIDSAFDVVAVLRLENRLQLALTIYRMTWQKCPTISLFSRLEADQQFLRQNHFGVANPRFCDETSKHTINSRKSQPWGAHECRNTPSIFRMEEETSVLAQAASCPGWRFSRSLFSSGPISTFIYRRRLDSKGLLTNCYFSMTTVEIHCTYYWLKVWFIAPICIQDFRLNCVNVNLMFKLAFDVVILF